MDRSIPLTRMAFLLRYAVFIERLGAPAGTLFTKSSIPDELLAHPEAAVGLKNAYHFGELACKAADSEHLGLFIGMQTSLRDLGLMGEQLRCSTTVYDYFRKAIALYDMLMAGQRIWLSYHGEQVHFNVATFGKPGLGSYQSQLENLAVTTMALRRVLGRDWSPSRVCLTYKSREHFPENSCFAGSQIVSGADMSYMTFPRAALGMPFSDGSLQPPELPECVESHRFSDNESDIVRLQIEALLCEASLHIDTVAESLMMSRRSLQRALAEQGTSYSELLADTRAHEAIKRLQYSDEPITDIAFDLGYKDASNFTRAFRLRNGISPQHFRQNLNPDLPLH